MALSKRNLILITEKNSELSLKNEKQNCKNIKLAVFFCLPFRIEVYRLTTYKTLFLLPDKNVAKYLLMIFEGRTTKLIILSPRNTASLLSFLLRAVMLRFLHHKNA